MVNDSTHYDAVIADLEAKRDQLNAMIETLKQMKGVGLPLASAVMSSSHHGAASDTVIRKDAFFGMTIPDAAKKYLSLVKRTKPHMELCDSLLAGGFKTSSPNFREVVRSTLSRNPDFVKFGKEWGLAEWYGSRNTRKAKRGGSTPVDSIELLPEGRNEDTEDEYPETEDIGEGKEPKT
jgi:hypothetical protein